MHFLLRAITALFYLGLAVVACAQTSNRFDIFIDDVPVGFTDKTEVALLGGTEIVESRTIGANNRRSGTLVITTRRDDIGRVTSMKSIDGVRQVTAVVKGGKIEVTSHTRFGSRKTVLKASEDLRFDSGEGLLGSWIKSGKSQLSVLNFNINSQTIELLKFSIASNGEIIRQNVHEGELRSVSFLTLDPTGLIIRIRQPLLSGEATMLRSNQGTKNVYISRHLKAAQVGIKSPFKIPSGALNKRLRFAFTYREGIAIAIPETSEQSVINATQGIVFEVCETCGPQIMLTEEQRWTYSSPSPWIESDAPTIRRIAAPVNRLRAEGAIDDNRSMNLLAKRARRRIKDISFAGHYSAVQSLKRRKGDCTEDAVTLAALGRAVGIPTRVVSGLIYSRERYHGISNVFVSHNWTQAYIDGRWESYDMSLGDFDSTHIVLATGHGDPAMISGGNLLGGMLKLESLALVKD